MSNLSAVKAICAAAVWLPGPPRGSRGDRRRIKDLRSRAHTWLAVFDRAVQKQIAATFGADAKVTHIEAHPTDTDTVLAYYREGQP